MFSGKFPTQRWRVALINIVVALECEDYQSLVVAVVVLLVDAWHLHYCSRGWVWVLNFLGIRSLEQTETERESTARDTQTTTTRAHPDRQHAHGWLRLTRNGDGNTRD